MTETENSVDGVVLSPVLQRWLDDVTALWDEIGKRDARVIELEAQIAAERQVDPAVVEELNRRNAELASEVAERSRAVEGLRLSVDDLTGKVAAATEARDTAQREAHDATEEARKVAVKLTELDEEYNRNLSNVTEKAHLDLAEAARLADEARINAEVKYNALKLDLTTQITEQADAHRIATAAAKEKSDREAAEAKDKSDRDAAETKARHERETAEAKDLHDREITDARERHEAEVSRLRAKHEKEVSDLVSNHNSIVDGMQRRYDALDNYIPVVVAENQQIGKTKGIAVASAYIDAATAEEADLVRVKKLAAAVVPAVALSADPRTQDFFAPPAVEDEVLPEQPTPPVAETQQAQEEAYDDADDEDDFSVQPEAPVEEPVAPAPTLPIVDNSSNLPPFDPSQYLDDAPSSLPAFNPEQDDNDDEEGSSLPSFEYEPEPVRETSYSDEKDNAADTEDDEGSELPEFDAGDFAFARKLQ